MSLTLTYTRRYLTETLRTPVMLLSIAPWPVVVMLFFIVPNLAHDPFAMTSATATMVVFAVLLSCVAHFATIVSATRESPWGAYLRTLPGGLGPEFVASVITGLAVVAAGVVPVVVVAALFTAATASLGQVLLALLALLGTVLTFTLMGLAIGYLLSFRATIIVTPIAALALAVAGGMFGDPYNRPALIETVSPFLPTRGANDLVNFALVGTEPNTLALVTLVAWTAVFAVLLLWGYRRNEGRRFT